MPRSPTHAFIGRQVELSQFADATIAGPGPSVTLLGGDAGTGKTRLLEEVAARVTDAGGLALVGSCVQVGDFGLPYLPIVDALRTVESDPVGEAVLRAESEVRPALARLLPQFAAPSEPPPPLPDALAQGQLFEALHRVLTVLATTRPVLLVIEDVHWADRSTRDLIAFLARTLRAGRVAVVASYRTDDLHRRHPLRQLLAEAARLPHVRRIHLGPFSRSELAQLLDELVGSAVDVQLVDKVFARSEGNAFFAEQLLRAAQAGGRSGRLPDELADVLLSRVEELGPAGRLAVRAAAVAGRRVAHELLVAAADAPDTEQGLREAVEAGLMTTDGDTYAFRHALFQEAVYGELLPGERVRLHARFARLLDAADEPGGAAELAHHLMASHDLGGALAASVRAATSAEAMAAPAEALRHLEQSIALLDRLGDTDGIDRGLLLRRAAEAASNSGDVSRAVAFGKAAVAAADEHPEDIRARAATRERLARLQFEADLDGEEPSRIALELLDGDLPSELLAAALATRARAMFRQQNPELTAQMLDRAIAMAGRSGAQAIATDALITKNLMVRRGFLQDPEVPPLARTLARMSGPDGLNVRHRALRFLAAQLMEDGDLAGALAAADEGVRLTLQEGLSWSAYGLDLRLMRGWVLAALGRWDEVLADSLVAVYAPTEPGRVLATQAVAVLVGRGDPEAEPLLFRLRGTGDVYAELQLDFTEIDLRLGQGRPAEAVALARNRRRSLVADDGWAMERVLLAAREAAALADLAEAARRDGTEDAELRAAASFTVDAAGHLPVPPALRGPYGRSWLLRVRAEADRAAGSDTADQWRAVLHQAGLAGRVEDQIYAAVRAAPLLLQAGDRTSAAVLLRVALDQAVGLRAEPRVAEIRGILQRARLRLPTDPTAPAAPATAVLTAREIEVLALVAKGLSNRRVGEALFITDKTASVHLSHILGKLGATSRTEAVSLARQRGLLVDDNS